VQVNLERAGYEVITAYDGIEAMEKVHEENPDMILLDILMPRMNGWEVIKALKDDPKTSDLPIVVLTQLSQAANVFRGWSAGVSSYLTKPFSPREVLVHIERIFKVS